MAESVCIEGPIEVIDGTLMLRIPVSVGGDRLAPAARGIGQIEGDYLCVQIPIWLAEKLCVTAGDLVVVDNENGKFTITRSDKNDAGQEDSSAPARVIH